MTVEKFKGREPPYPPGSIIIWTQEVSEIPPGWMYCDGDNGTPDLRDKFVRGVGSATTDPGNEGGTHTQNLDESQLPSHNHNGSMNDQSQHKHYLTHGGSGSTSSDGSTADRWRNYNGDPDDYNTSETKSSGSHSHSLNIQNAGGGADIDNRPEHMEVVYIQKS